MKRWLCEWKRLQEDSEPHSREGGDKMRAVVSQTEGLVGKSAHPTGSSGQGISFREPQGVAANRALCEKKLIRELLGDRTAMVIRQLSLLYKSCSLVELFFFYCARRARSILLQRCGGFQQQLQHSIV